MIAYIGRRLLLALPTALGAVSVVFVIVRILPGDPAVLAAGPDATPQDVARLRHFLGTDQPIYAQYLAYLSGLVRFDLGNSIITRDSVWTDIAARLPYTLEIAGIAIVIAAAVGIGFGTLASLKPGSGLDLAISGLAVFGVSMPSFWLGLMLIIAFAVELRVLPAGGIAGAFSWVLPSITLSTVAIGITTRMTRSAMLEVLSQDYIRTANAKGLPRPIVVGKHALRNALNPIMTVLGLQFGALLGGAVLTETVFSWPGIGRLLVDSILARDYPVIQGVTVVFALSFILVNLITDLLYPLVDPRVKL